MVEAIQDHWVIVAVVIIGLMALGVRLYVRR